MDRAEILLHGAGDCRYGRCFSDMNETLLNLPLIMVYDLALATGDKVQTDIVRPLQDSFEELVIIKSIILHKNHRYSWNKMHYNLSLATCFQYIWLTNF